jgi:hypothetical protein
MFGRHKERIMDALEDRIASFIRYGLLAALIFA